MQVLHGLEGLRSLPPGLAISIGNFDGVHLGHQRILQTARELALGVAVVTFEPHPMTVLRPGHAPPRLTPPGVKQPLIESCGADYLVILPPEKGILGLSAEAFWHILRDEVRPAHLVEGGSFRFGKGAAGDVEALRKWTSGSGVTLHVVESVLVALLDMQVAPVSSSLIRFLLDFGRVRDAAICLGRGYFLSGVVSKGAGRGRTIGIPTANIACEDQLIPADAVYAGRCAIDGKAYPAAVNIGPAPTFGEQKRLIEAHLIGFSGDLYGRTIGVELLDWLREQQRFSGVDALKSQLGRDLEQTLTRFGDQPGRPIAVPNTAASA